MVAAWIMDVWRSLFSSDSEFLISSRRRYEMMREEEDV